MEPSIAVALLGILFGATHIGLASVRLRSRFVARLGALGFTLLFSLIAALIFSLLVHTYADHRFDGLPGPDLGSFTALRGLAMLAIGAGLMLIGGCIVTYPQTPMLLFAQSVDPPRGLERITRHPFFAGFTLLALAHVLLATHLVGVAFFGSLALLAMAGAKHQDAKLLALRGSPYAEYLSATSTFPFGAVVGGRQRIVWSELPVGALALGFALTLILWFVHDSILAHGGAWVIGVLVGGAAIATLRAWHRSRSRAGTSSGDVVEN
jgi:uncharacterized membrane protein